MSKKASKIRSASVPSHFRPALTQPSPMGESSRSVSGKCILFINQQTPFIDHIKILSLSVPAMSMEEIKNIMMFLLFSIDKRLPQDYTLIIKIFNFQKHQSS